MFVCKLSRRRLHYKSTFDVLPQTFTLSSLSLSFGIRAMTYQEVVE